MGFRDAGVAATVSHSEWRKPRGAGRPSTEALLVALIAILSGGLFWLVWIYGNGLRDARYLDGWVLAGGMGLQICFHIAVKTGGLSPKAMAASRTVHIVIGLLLIAAFVSHASMSLPDTVFEWALWSFFVLVTMSGVFGTALAQSRRAKYRIDPGLDPQLIDSRRQELARSVEATVARQDTAATINILPALPYDAWIQDLYTNQLREFLQGPRNTAAHVVGSQRPIDRLTGEIDGLSRYVDQNAQDKLAAIKQLVIEKDRLDYAQVYFALSKGWLLIHVPATYALVVLAVLHVVIVYAFSSGAW